MSRNVIPADMDALVLDCLAKDPALRPPSADVLRARLVQVSVPRWDQGRARVWWEQHEAELVGTA
jgi:hypothetical protein